MSDLTRTNIASPERGHHPPAGPRAPRREELEARTREILQRGRSTKADLIVIENEGREWVVKDFGTKSWWVRAIGRVQIGREWRAYRRLGPVPGVPTLGGRVDAHALAVARIHGVRLAHWPERCHSGTALYEQLRGIVDSLHLRGVVHLDLRSSENVLLGDDGRVYVLDLASAAWLRPKSLAHRLFFDWLRVTDRAALLKWKRLLQAGPYTSEERVFLRRYRFWRRLWIFNRKRPAQAEEPS